MINVVQEGGHLGAPQQQGVNAVQTRSFRRRNNHREDNKQDWSSPDKNQRRFFFFFITLFSFFFQLPISSFFIQMYIKLFLNILLMIFVSLSVIQYFLPLWFISCIISSNLQKSLFQKLQFLKLQKFSRNFTFSKTTHAYF